MTVDDTERLRWIALPAEAEVCPLCGNSTDNAFVLDVAATAQSAGRHEPVRVARCGACRSAWCPGQVIGDNYPAADPDLMTEQFLLLIDHYIELTGGLDWRVMFAERLTANRGRVIEVGCNTGVLLDYISRVWGAQVVGLEPSLYAVAGAQRFGLDIRPEYIADHLRSEPQPYDVAIATEVIEHVPDPVQFLRELRQLVGDGGQVLITTPNAEGLQPGTPPGVIYAMLSVGAHRFVFSAGALRAAAYQAGFAVVHVEAEPATLVAVLSARPFELEPPSDPRRRLLDYFTDRSFEPGADDRPVRQQLADLIARYYLARELDVSDAERGERRIDDMLRSEFAVDVCELGPLVTAAENTTDIFQFGRLAPFSLARYLYFRGHRDDLSEQQRTEMWETAIVLIGRGIAADPVNLFTLDLIVDRVLAALDGRTSGRWRQAAQAALAGAPELGDRVLGDVPLGVAGRTRHRIGRMLRAAGLR